MKDLNRNEVYDLIGITHEQAEDLLQWLIENDTGWEDCDLEYLVSNKNIFFDTDWNEWLMSFYYNETPTLHISTLFEQSYEEKLIEAKKVVETLKAKIKEQKLTQL